MDINKENFSEWYHEVLDLAGVIDQRYDVKGCYVWLPFGFQIRKLVFGKLRELLDESGHQETLFPELIPENMLKKEGEHVKGFENEVFWVTHGGLTPLDVKLALRPTSETVMYPMFKLWIRSHADLPLKIYQVVNTFRYETKHTRPLIRDREISTFKEAHCAHADKKDMEAEMKLIQKQYGKFWDALGVPALVMKRPEWDKFPGSDYTISWDAIMPDGKTLQIATSHNLGTTFSKTFDIKYEKDDGSHEYPYLTCHGISGRSVAALIGVHGDDNGLILPPEFAPVQIAITPIIFKGKDEGVMKAAEELEKKLSKFRVVLDKRDITPGNKYYYWEMKGTPIRIEVGPRDVKAKSVVIVRRDNGKKETVALKDVEARVKELLDDIYMQMWKKAQKEMQDKIVFVKTRKKKKKYEGKPVVLKAEVCCEECAKNLEDALKSFEFRGTLMDKKAAGTCATCGAKAKFVGVLSNAY